MKTIDCDYLVVGSGIAGLMSAIHLAEGGAERVLVVTKRGISDSNSEKAQGGISCVMEPTDSFDAHVADTLDAGAGLCDEATVRRIVEAGPARIAELERYGVVFDKGDSLSGYDLGREGGHTARRILHSGDITGREVEARLVAHVRSLPNVEVRENVCLIDLVTTRRLGLPGANRCVGAYAFDTGTSEIFAIRAPRTVLATGGCGKVYLYTCNPDIATGDGIAIGWRAGADIANMEFIQFHPTCLFHPKAKSFLISEAVRGEGAELCDRDGVPFMEKYDRRGSLAPRDIVARAIDSELKRTAAPYACLDIRHKSVEFLRRRFPNIYAKCLEFGIDMARDLIPVVPAAHYCCGGIKATVEGVTSLQGLYAVGEVACTGLHGANRLASNSLLEALVCPCEMARRLSGIPAPDVSDIAIPNWISGNAVPSDEAVILAHNWAELRTCMWDYVGIVRSAKRLQRAYHRIRNIRNELRQYYFDYLVTPEILEVRNLADVAELIVRCAHKRRESRGLHKTLDYPERLGEARDTILHGRVARPYAASATSLSKEEL
ncbi:MAG: L-aspartate oxidase [Kiritimatiellae bacterium]|nr:L-aspartate oxidase [Kiritimatiellia bacterium]